MDVKIEQPSTTILQNELWERLRAHREKETQGTKNKGPAGNEVDGKKISKSSSSSSSRTSSSSSSSTMTSKERASFKRAKAFTSKLSRTNRPEGQQKWVKELFIMKRDMLSNENKNVEGEKEGEEESNSPAIGIGLILELAKELLYSGIPEQVIELYAAYYDIILEDKATSNTNNNNNTVASNSEFNSTILNSIPVVPDSRLILLVTRALVAMDDLRGAISLLQACSRAGLEFDSESKSYLIADLASHSTDGLRASLQVRKSMINRKEKISAVGTIGLLKGLRMQQLQQFQQASSGADDSVAGISRASGWGTSGGGGRSRCFETVG